MRIRINKRTPAKALALAFLLSAFSPAFAQNYNYNYPAKSQPQTQQGNYNLPTLQGRVVTVPAGAIISGASTGRALSTKFLTTGDAVSFMLNQPYYFNNAMVLPAGTSIQGTAVIAQSAGFTGKYGRLKIVFNSAMLPNGQRVPLNGKIATADGTGVLTGGTGMERAAGVAKNTAVGAGTGALVGLIGAAVSGGKKGQGTAIMTGIGAGTGLAKSFIDKGNDVYIEAGQPMDIMLELPMTVEGAQQQQQQNYNNYNYNY